MPKINFKLSDAQKFDALWALLNPEFNEEGNWTVTYAISAVFDDYALAYNYETGESERIYYAKNDENDMVEITEHVKCFIVDVTEAEKGTLDTLRALNGGTYDLVSEELTNAHQNAEDASEFSAKIEELNETISTLTTEKTEVEGQVETYTAELETANTTISSLTEEVESLRTYRNNVETQNKMNVLGQYTEMLSEDILATYRENISDYSVEELDMHLAYELKKTNSSIFTKEPEPEFVPKSVPENGINAILSKYKK